MLDNIGRYDLTYTVSLIDFPNHCLKSLIGRSGVNFHKTEQSTAKRLIQQDLNELVTIVVNITSADVVR